MRKLVVTENITLDGVIDMAEGWFDPLNEDVDQSDISAASTEHQEAADALLVGRNTFESFREFWPKQTDDRTGVSAYLNAVNKYVVSSTLDDPGWENSTVLRGPVVDEVQALKESPGRNIVATGSTQLVHAMIAAGMAKRRECVRAVSAQPAPRGRRLSRRTAVARLLDRARCAPVIASSALEP